eukprot:7379687-Prymnesium_polylepis.2
MARLRAQERERGRRLEVAEGVRLLGRLWVGVQQRVHHRRRRLVGGGKVKGQVARLILHLGRFGIHPQKREQHYV